ncbi:MAG: hypothetical protein GVY16_10555 [Planctomycetes bacterium]|jgi:hypothetical protein|nr:hypothetical protein [Planctomycetota bacterium]
MAEEASSIQNKWLLIIAIALGIIVVVIYNAHVKAIQQAQESNMVSVVGLNRDLRVGDRVTADAIEKVEHSQDALAAVGDVVLWENRASVLRDAGYSIKRSVSENDLLLWSDVEGGANDRKRPEKAPEGTLKITLNIESRRSPGDVLRVGDHINLVGMFTVAGSSLKNYFAMKGVPVVGVGGAGPQDDDDARGGRRAMRSYRRINLAVTPEISLKLKNLETHLVGNWSVDVLPANASLPADHGTINPALQTLANEARAPEAPFVPAGGNGGADKPVYPLGG